ncbi:MAG TPA: L-histidine N(alpha)-methyltransferase [Candidatus Saccharimonadales bacterium]
MKFFKNSDLMHLFSVSDKTVRNWIDAAKAGKNGLELYQDGARLYIVDSINNDSILSQLASHGRRYRNRRTHRIITPRDRFYEQYTVEQLAQILHGIEIDREIPQEYRFFGDGAHYWNGYLKKLSSAGHGNILTAQNELLDLGAPYFARLTSDFKHINLIDLGVGNGFAAKGILERLISEDKLRSYIGIDLSQDLLDIATTNIRGWAGHSLHITKAARNFVSEGFGDLLIQKSYGDDAAQTLNIALVLGGSILNMADPRGMLKNVRHSLGEKDILVSAIKLDGEKARRFFDFNLPFEKGAIPTHTKQMLELLGIDQELYEVEQFYDEHQRCRVIQIRLKVSVGLRFKYEDFSKILEIRKGEALVLWRAHHYTEAEFIALYNQCGFNTLYTAQTLDEEFLLTISRIKKEKPYFSPGLKPLT